MSPSWLYVAVLVLVVIERLVELRISRRHVRIALASGGVEAGAGHYPAMVVLHAAFLVACPLEVWLLERPLVPGLFAAMIVLVGGAMALRYWTIFTLGDRWTTRVIWVPGRSIEDGGPFRWVRHPNYLAVAIEMAALPLMHGAWWTALVFSTANAMLLRVRVKAEEKHLRAFAETDDKWAANPRFLPWRAV